MIDKLKVKYTCWVCKKLNYRNPGMFAENIPFWVKINPLFSISIYLSCYLTHNMVRPLVKAMKEATVSLSEASKAINKSRLVMKGIDDE